MSVLDFAPIVHGEARRVFAAGHDYEDLCQIGWVGALTAVRDHRPERGPLPPFVRLCVRRQLVDLISAQRSERNAALNTGTNDEAALAAVRDRGDLDTTLEARRLLCRVHALPDRQRRVVVAFACGLSYAEIAAAEGIAWKSCDSALQRARDALRSAA